MGQYFIVVGKGSNLSTTQVVFVNNLALYVQLSCRGMTRVSRFQGHFSTRTMHRVPSAVASVFFSFGTIEAHICLSRVSQFYANVAQLPSSSVHALNVEYIPEHVRHHVMFKYARISRVTSITFGFLTSDDVAHWTPMTSLLSFRHIVVRDPRSLVPSTIGAWLQLHAHTLESVDIGASSKVDYLNSRWLFYRTQFPRLTHISMASELDQRQLEHLAKFPALTSLSVDKVIWSDLTGLTRLTRLYSDTLPDNVRLPSTLTSLNCVRGRNISALVGLSALHELTLRPQPITGEFNQELPFARTRTGASLMYLFMTFACCEYWRLQWASSEANSTFASIVVRQFTIAIDVLSLNVNESCPLNCELNALAVSGDDHAMLDPDKPHIKRTSAFLAHTSNFVDPLPTARICPELQDTVPLFKIIERMYRR